MAKDPQSQKRDQGFSGSGFTQPDAVPDVRADGSFWGGGRGMIRLRDSNDFIDLSTVTNRQSRYREYERLQNMAEIEFAMNVFADESCVSGKTLISTPFFGQVPIEWLAENKANEKFAVYCWDFEKDDFTIGWAYDPRVVKEAPTIRIIFEDGSEEIMTEDHRVLLEDNSWIQAGELDFGHELKAFYRIPARQSLTGVKHHQFPRIRTNEKGWIHERQFIDEWRTGKIDPKLARTNRIANMIANGLSGRKITQLLGHQYIVLSGWLNKAGFSIKEMKWLGHKSKTRRVLDVRPYKTMKVYDLSVEKHQNFCTDSIVCHNCQRGENEHPFEINVGDREIEEELKFLYWHKKMLNLDQKKLWGWFKNLFVMGDFFLEVVIDPENPSDGIMNVMPLPADSIYRIETTKGRLIEFQQSKEGPDYQSLARVEITKATRSDLQQATAIRFSPDQVIHIRIGDDRKTYYPYGISLIEAARGPAHQLRLMEDAMVVYRLIRAPERRVFYIDVQQLPPFKAEAFMDRMKDQFKKKKVATNKGSGVSSIEERWHSQPADEDFWIPIRPNSNTRVETLPGACLALDTKIPLLDGTENTLSDIIRRWDNGEEMWAYSCDPKTGAFAPGKITWAGVTRKNTQVVKVKLDNGEYVVCTPDHKFPVQSKGKIEAQNLEPGDSLFPFNTRKKKITYNRNDYHQIYDNVSKTWKFTHREVANFFLGTKLENSMFFDEQYKNEPKNVIHHWDCGRFNNNPGNLFWMAWNDHIKLHRYLPTKPEVKKKISKGLKQYHKSLSEKQKNRRNKILKKRSKLGTSKLQKLLQDKDFNENFREQQKAGWVVAAKKNPELHKNRGEKISERNLEFWSDPENKKKVFDKQTVIYPQSIFNKFKELLSQNIRVHDALVEINSCADLINEFVESNHHIVRKGFKPQDGLTVDHSNKMVRAYGYKGVRELRKSLPDNKGKNSGKTLHGKFTITYPQSIFACFMKQLNSGMKVEDILDNINKNKKLMKNFLNVNKHVKRKGIDLSQGIKRTHVRRMVESYGYRSLQHAREEAACYNHKVVSVEWLDEKVDTGTLTIDGLEEWHDFHTFALSKGFYTCNSNLGEIDDAIYFRNKLFTALQFPKNYINQEDPGQTRITLSAQDVKFARLIERLQSYMEDGLWDIADRHLKLRGFPEERYEDLEIKMTPPSEWRELSRAEVITNRINNAGSLKGSQMLSDFDILVLWLKYSEKDAKEIIARNKIQKLEDLKLQVMAQNPILMGVGTPEGEKEGQEMGTEPGGQNPMPGGEETTPQQPSPEGQQGEGLPQGSPPATPQGPPIEEPSSEDIKKFDLDIEDFSADKDEEDIDYSTEGD